MKITTEAHVKKLVRDWFNSHGAWSYAPIQNGLGVHGIPDRIGCIPITVTPEMVGRKIGLFVAAESKAPHRITEKDGGVSAHQKHNLDAINKAYGLAFVAYDEKLLAELSELVGF